MYFVINQQTYINIIKLDILMNDSPSGYISIDTDILENWLYYLIW